MERQYIDPTPESRRRLGFMFALALIIGVALIEGLQMLLAHIKTLPTCDQIAAFRWLFAAGCCGMAMGGIWSSWFARQALKAGQLPLPGTSVFRRTAIYRGRAAKWRAYAALGLGVALIAGPAWIWYVGETYAERASVTQRCPAT